MLPFDGGIHADFWGNHANIVFALDAPPSHHDKMPHFVLRITN